MYPTAHGYQCTMRHLSLKRSWEMNPLADRDCLTSVLFHHLSLSLLCQYIMVQPSTQTYSYTNMKCVWNGSCFVLGALPGPPYRESQSVRELESQLCGCDKRSQHRCKPAITNRAKPFAPAAETVNLALSPISLKSWKKLLCTHVASQVFIRRHTDTSGQQ